MIPRDLIWFLLDQFLLLLLSKASPCWSDKSTWILTSPVGQWLWYSRENDSTRRPWSGAEPNFYERWVRVNSPTFGVDHRPSTNCALEDDSVDELDVNQLAEEDDQPFCPHPAQYSTVVVESVSNEMGRMRLTAVERVKLSREVRCGGTVISPYGDTLPSEIISCHYMQKYAISTINDCSASSTFLYIFSLLTELIHSLAVQLLS